MRTAIFSISALILIQSILFSITAHAQNAKPIHIPFALTDDGHTVIKAEINGKKGRFIFDTGAGLNMLTKEFSNAVGSLERTDSFYTGHRATGEEVQLSIWLAGSFLINQYEANDKLFSVYDIDFPLDGLISLTAFKDTPVTIDYKNEELIVETRQSMRKRMEQPRSILPIQISTDREKTLEISTFIHLGNKLKLQVKLDSGAGFNVYRFNAKYMKPLEIDPAHVEHEYQTSIFKPAEGNDYYYTSIPRMSTSNGEIIEKDLKVTFIDGLIYEGITSINWLGDQVTIDIPNKRLVIN